MNRFISERKDNWERLEDLLAILDASSLKGLSRMEVREFGELYRRAATDLAIARAKTRDVKLINYLNSLVIRAHGKIYRAENQGVNLIRQFFAEDFPRAFRRTGRYTLTAFTIFTFFAVASFLLCYNDLNFADELGLSDLRFAVQTDYKWWLSLNEANQIGSSAISVNNSLVALKTFAYGASFGIGSIYILVYNGLQIGGVLGVCYKLNTGFANELAAFMVGHGVIELSCIFIIAGAGLAMGYSIVNPGDLTRIQALKKSGLESVHLAVGCVILLFIAGIIEGFLSPSALPPFIKFGTGILTGIAMYAHLFLAGGES